MQKPLWWRETPLKTFRSKIQAMVIVLFTVKLSLIEYVRCV